jgi:D-amino-acid oxidase
VYPVQGQVIKAVGENNGGYYLDQSGELSLSYVLPRINDIVLGGTAVEDAGSGEPDENVTEQILSKVKKLDPSLKINKIVSVDVGLRPARDEVRLEKEKIDGKTIIHNYGHGGAGFTLSWGCADEVVKLVKKIR